MVRSNSFHLHNSRLERHAAAADLLEERVEEGDGLDGLPQAHLISQDGVGVLGPGEAQPVESLQLVGVQLAARCRDVIRLLLVLLSDGLWGGGGGGGVV